MRAATGVSPVRKPEESAAKAAAAQSLAKLSKVLLTELVALLLGACFPQPAILNRLGEHRRQINRDSECAMAWRGIELKDRESADVMPPASCHCGEAVATR